MSTERDVKAGRFDLQRIKDNFSDLHPALSSHQAAVESARCLFCFDAPCTEACPTGIDIPGFIRKISTDNLLGSAVTILSENIMGGTCANVCPVEELCEQVCVKNTDEEQAVQIGRLQRFATDHLFKQGVQPFQRKPDSGKRVAVVGAGPAGLSCAHRLAMLGHKVTLFETRHKAGGLNEYGLAAYKMNDQRAQKEVAFILEIGNIEIKTTRSLGVDFSLASLRSDYDAVFLGIGHANVNTLDMKNENTPGVHNAVDFITRIRQEKLEELPVGRRVIVIGGGNTAIDIAVQTKKLGAEYVTMAYRRGKADMSATDYEQVIAQTNGVFIKTWASPVEILADEAGVTGVEFEYTRKNDKGRLVGTGETFTIEADQVFKAIGQHLDESVLEFDDHPDMENGRIRVDDKRRTSVSGVWAGGDCVDGEDLTVVAVEDGKIAAESIHKELMDL
jgi:dihydropyrimidine dehydrogenase (NAD+) subunit PreT